ncbi:MAG: hypothetical protein M5U26_30635 [Planctomycetota bacterium]|nr:hypothetical protein [Planctomycetota bacterium]
MKSLKAQAEGSDEPAEGARAAYESQLKRFAPILAGYLRELADVAKNDGASVKPLLRAYELDPAATEGALARCVAELQKKEDWPRAAEVLAGAQRVKPDERRAQLLLDLEFKAAEKEPLLRKAKDHPLRYYLSLPKGWQRGKKYPILVTVDGAGCNFLGSARSYTSRRGDEPYIVVAPCTFINTSNHARGNYAMYSDEEWKRIQELPGSAATFDHDGLLKVLDDVRADFGGEEKFYMTGFSGGGNLTWIMIFLHPEMLAAAAPACPNCIPLRKVSDHEARKTLPVHVYQGDKDQFLATILEPQWRLVQAMARAGGFEKIDREMLPGVGHSPCVEKVLGYFNGIRKGK